MTFAELRTMLIRQKAAVMADALKYTDITQGVTALDASGRDAIVAAARARDGTGLGTLILSATNARLVSVATAEVDAVVTDGKITEAELEALFP